MIVAFSGACNSGKTTMAQRFHDKFVSNVELHDEVIRREVNDIDEIRKDGWKYFELQMKIIKEKKDEELKVAHWKNNNLHIFDRSLADSFYYMTNFVDVSQFTKNQIEIYNQQINVLTLHAKYAFEHVYDKVVLFSPLESEDGFKDALRPANLKNIQTREYVLIRTYTEAFCREKSKIIYYDVASHDEFSLFRKIMQ